MTDTAPRYRRSPRTPRDYSAYLDMYGHLYGDMSDPAQRAAAVASLRRRDALSHAAARRDIWRTVTGVSTRALENRLRIQRHLIEECGDMRPPNIRDTDIYTYRLVASELRRRTAYREALARLSRGDYLNLPASQVMRDAATVRTYLRTHTDTHEEH